MPLVGTRTADPAHASLKFCSGRVGISNVTGKFNVGISAGTA
jgi:polyisoprenoid-binding protein YceI